MHDHTKMSCFLKISRFSMPFSGFIFGGGRLILPLLPQKYSCFQNTSLLGFILDGGHLILAKSSSFQNTCLSGFIFSRSCSILTLSSKFSSFQSTSLLGFIFGSDRLILSLLPKKFSNFHNTSLEVQIQ